MHYNMSDKFYKDAPNTIAHMGGNHKNYQPIQQFNNAKRMSNDVRATNDRRLYMPFVYE